MLSNRELIKKARANYMRQYRKEHPEEQQTYKINTIINQYKKIVQADPSKFVERMEVMK